MVDFSGARCNRIAIDQHKVTQSHAILTHNPLRRSADDHHHAPVFGFLLSFWAQLRWLNVDVHFFQGIGKRDWSLIVDGHRLTSIAANVDISVAL